MIDFKRIGTSDLFQMTPGTGDVGVVVYLAPLGQTLPDPLPLDKAWTRYNGMFIWLQKLPSDATAFASAFRSSTPTDVPHASFAWVDGDPDDLSKALVSQMTLAPGGGGPDIAVTTGAPQPQIQFRQVGFFVIRGNDVSLDQGTGRFTITNTTAGIYLTVVDTDIKKLGPKVTLDLQGSEQGAFAFQILGLVQNDISADNLDTALYYTAAQQGSSKPAKYRFPLLDLLASTDPAGRQIDLAGRFFAADQISSYMSFDTAKAQVLGSYLRTDAGHSLEVQPLDGARLDFSLRPPDVGSKDFFYFTPAGGFELVAPATGQAVVGADEEPPKLLCGLTGTEGIAIVPRDAAANGSGTPGDVAYFFSRQPAYAPSLGQGGDEDGPILTDTYTTSYLAVGPNPAGARESLGADGATVTDYFAQPPDSALYARNTGVNTLPDGQQFLGLLEPVAASLPAPTAATSFPVAPYAGFAPSNTLAVQQLEAGALAPRRKQIISKVTAVTRAARAARAEARLLAAEEEPDPSTTPQGLLTKVMDSRWSDLRLAHNEGEQLTFDTVSEPFRNSLQSSKLFLVVSSDGVLGQFSKQISIGGWPFSIDLGASGSSGDADGNFTNILIFKFYDKSIVDLAGDGSVWAKSDDPDKPFNGDQPALQKWLTETYIPNIEKQAEEQPELYQTFLEDVLQNPAWNGILALEVSIPAGQLPEEVRGLLGGIDIDKFRVNHFGINLNKVDDSEGGGDGGFDIKTSSLFALIDYDVTGDEEQSEFLRSLEAGVDDAYAFKVLTLKVLFGNTEIQHFESRIELTINSLFDEPAEGSEGEGEDQNKIELQGSYERQDTGETDADGKPIYNSTYTFTYEGEKVFNIAESLPAASRVIKAARFTKVQFTTVSDKSEGNKSTITSTFGFFGELEFGEGLDFDFFSFEKLAFADMKIGMAFELIDDRVVGRPAFVFDPGDLRFDVAVSQTRQDSLLGNFPLRLQGFTFATAPFDVTEDGFLAVPDIVPGLTFVKKAIFGLNMVLRLGSMGGLTSGKEGFEIELLAGWLPSGKDPDHPDGGVVFGLKLPSSSGGEKEIGIQGVLTLSVEDFGFQKLELSNGSGFVYALFLKKSVLKILGTQIPPGGNFSLLLFVPQAQGGGFRPDFSNTGWFVAYEAGESSGDGDGDGELLLRPLADGRLQSELLAARPVREDGGNGGGEGGSSILKLDYLGIGQRIVLRDAGDLNNVQEVIDAMKEKLLPESGDDLIEQLEAIYDPERGWLIGADLTLFEIVRLAAVFYDPELYGLLIAFTEKASLLKNFSFEILYKRISDTVGVYKIVVKLPDTLRQLEFGAVSVQLPTIGVDIFTNGDFRLDFGFPAGNDFSESFGIQAIILGVPVLGFGGFYFAKLSSETSETVPKDTPVKGSFNPVLELGFGFSIGVGKTIEKGIFRAGLSVTFQGILEGTAAWWTPDPESVALVPALAPAATPVIFERAPDFYLIKGTFSVVGELYGAVDFGIVKAGVEVRIWVTIGATFESYADLVLFIEAGVRVRITIVIGSFKIFGKKIEIKISFSFSTTVRATFTIADKRRAPWDDGSLFAARRARQLTTSQPVGPIPWQSIELPGGKSKLPILFSPQNTIGVDSNGKQWTQCVNTFAVTGLKTEGGAAAPFVSLMRAMVAWTVNQALALPPGSNPYDQSLSADDLEVMLERLAEPVTLARTPNGPLAYYTNTDGPLASGALRDFLAANFDVTLSGTPDGSSEVPAAIFPVLPDLQVKTTGQAGGDESVQFWSFAPKTVQFQDDLAEYFAKLLVNFDVRDGVGQTLLAGTPAVSMATIVCDDYFALLVKAGVNAAQELVAASDDETMKVSAILDALDSSGKLEQIGAQASRYLQHGLRIPTSFPATPTTPTKALYLMDGQQFPIRLTDDTAWTVEMSVNPAASFIGVDTTVPPKMTISADKDDLGRQTVIALQTAKVDTGSSSAEPLATLAAKPLEFALQNKTVWQPAGAPEAGIFAYGADLQNRLETDGALQMVLRNAPGMGPVDALGLGVVDDPHYWSLRIDLRVQKIVSSTQNPTPLPNTYQIGGAAEAERDLLKRWLDAVLAGDALGVAGIDILYKNPDSSVTGMVSGQIDPSRILLMKTNLSTESAPAGSAAAAFLADAAVPSDEFSATLDDPAKFLRLIWEVSIVNAGGYFLFYQDTQGKGLPDQIFDGGTLSASVTFLVRYANRAQALAATNFRTGGVREVTADTVGPYTNVLVLEPTAGESESGDVLYAEAPEIPAYHAAFATDSLGFQVTRPNPETSLDLGGELARMAGTSEGLTRDQVRAVLLEAGLAADSDELIEVMKAAGDDQAALANLFNLMTYWIEDAGGFRASIRGLPVGPTEEAGQGIDEEPAAGDPWTYRQAIPVAPYAVPESQADTVSPYAAVGKTVTVGFEYLDLFGNPAISNQTIPPLTTELSYFDPIIALDNWSGVTAEYQVTPKQGSAGTGTVGAQLSFDGNVFLGDTEGVASQDEKVANALETYRTLVDQLGGPGVSAYTTTSVAPGVKSPSALATLQKFAGQIVAFLESLPGGGGPGPIIDADPITFEVTLADRNKITANIFEVSAALHIERDPNLVDEEAKKDLPAAQAVATALTARTLPEQGDVSSDSNTQSLTGFAKLFEKAFPELVAATGQGASGPRTLFAIRMGAADGSQGITFDLAPSGSAPLYYAPPPLFNNLLARNIDVTFPAPAGGQPIPFRRNVAGVDMDVLGAGFLSATDLFLSAANAVPARQANPAGYFKVIDSKEPLADAISSSVLPVLADQQQTGAQLAAAKEAFRQRLLVVLGDAYNIATIVQHPASATNSDAGSGKTPPNLFGKVLGAVPKAARTLGGDLEENGFALTPTKVALPDGSTLLTTLLTTLKIEDQKSLTLDLGYRVTHVEYDIEPGFSNDPEGYQSSSWLTLILPQEVRPVGKGAATIPIPLRQYPLPPSLAAQSATPKVQVAEVCPNQARFTAAFGAPDGEISLETVEEWSYSYKYQETSPADQDTVITNILFNVGRDVPSARAFAAPSPDLLDWLVYFSEQYPKLEVPQTLAAFAADPGNEAARKAASVAVDQMAYLVSNIAQVWPAWVEGRVVGRSAALLRAPMDTFEYSYLVEEKRAQNEIELNLLGQTPEVFPNIEVPTASGGTQLLKPNHQAGTRFATYTYSNPPQTPDLVRTLIFDDLNVLNVENGWGGIQLSRNRVLIEGQTTTPVFVYNTPLVRFVNKKTPLINSVAAIDLAKNLKPAEKTLKGYLTALFDALLGGADPKLIAGAVTGAGQRLVKVGASYAYDGRGGKGGAQGPCDPTALNVYLPILQRTPFLYDTTNGQAFIDNLAAVIEQWQSELENPSTARAFYSFDISLFAALSDIQLPVLRINNLWLGLDQITG